MRRYGYTSIANVGKSLLASCDKRFKPVLSIGLLAAVLLFSACNATRRLSEDEYLLRKNTFEITGAKVDQDELASILKQKPNKRLLRVIPFNLLVYNIPDPEKVAINAAAKEAKQKAKNEERIQKGRKPKELSRTTGVWLRETIGEEPTIYDPSLTVKSTQQLGQYLKNKGYFNNQVKDTVIFKKKKAFVRYSIQTGQPYRIRKIIYSISDTSLRKSIKVAARQTKIRTGNNYDVTTLQVEREELAKRMRSLGYYEFAKEYIRYEVDSSLNQHMVDIVVKVLNPFLRTKNAQGIDSLIEKQHEQFYIKEVFVNAGFKSADDYQSTEAISYNGLKFLYGERMTFRPKVLSNAIFVRPGMAYNLTQEEYTFRRLQALKTFKFLNIRYEDAFIPGDTNFLNCYIELTPVPKQEATLQSEGTNRGGNLGIAGSLAYRNKNSFKGAEILELRFKGGLEAQRLATDNTEDLGDEIIDNFTPFNTIEFGTDVSVNIPDLLPPLVPKLITEFPKRVFSNDTSSLPRYDNPKTVFNLAYNFQNRPDFKRTLFNTALGYSWSGKRYNSYQFYPIELSLVQIDKSAAFQQQLDDIGNSVLSNSYNNHLIADSRFSYIRSTQSLNKARNFTYFRTNLEVAGNLLRGIFSATNQPRGEDGHYELFNIQFAQFAKVDFDLRKYTITTANSKVVYRAYGGVGYAYGNLGVLPFERSFFAGGANDIRAWQARGLGPGSLPDTLNAGIDQIGDIALQFNVEYRFKVTAIVEGAAFVDVGNIWLLGDDGQRLGGAFDFGQFYKDMAVGPGLGARLNFSFFIIRLDAGLQARDPALPEGERWIFQPKDITNAARETAAANRGESFDKYSSPQINLNLGIGYPF